MKVFAIAETTQIPLSAGGNIEWHSYHGKEFGKLT